MSLRGVNKAWAAVVLLFALSLFQIWSGIDDFGGSNDTSRWATVKALVHNGTYAIGQGKIVDGQTHRSGIITEWSYETIDMVLHPNGNFYSSKPPLMPTLMAGQYWLLKKTLGWDIEPNRAQLVKSVCLIWNFLPLIIFLFLFFRLLGDLQIGQFTKYFLMTSAGVGTFLTSGFLATVNNHLPAAFFAFFGVYAFLKIWLWKSERPRHFALAAFGCSFAVVLELPALALATAVFATLLVLHWRKTLRYSLPPVLLVAAAHFGTTYLAIDRLKPVYLSGSWYRFPGSYWASVGIYDIAETSKLKYAFHLLFGIHGLFSLTPIFLIALAGLFIAFRKEASFTAGEGRFHIFLRGLSAVFLAVIAFYILRTSNYGGQTAGPRWFFWLAPLFLLSMVPALERYVARSQTLQLLSVTLLSISVFSRSPKFPAWGDNWLNILNRGWGNASLTQWLRYFNWPLVEAVTVLAWGLVIVAMTHVWRARASLQKNSA